jgi:hypothetical protein
MLKHKVFSFINVFGLAIAMYAYAGAAYHWVTNDKGIEE